MLTGDPQTLAGGRKDLCRAGPGEDGRGGISRGIDNVLTVVEQHEQVAARERIGDGLGQGSARLRRDAERGRDGIGNGCGVVHRCELHQPHTVGESVGQLRADLERQARLAHAADSGQRHQPVGPHRANDLGDFARAADERRRGNRKIPAPRIQRAQRGKVRLQVVGSNLEHVLDASEVAQPVLTQIDEVDRVVLDQRRGQRADEDLATVTGRHDASRSVQHRPGVDTFTFDCLTGVEAHPHGQLQVGLRSFACELALHLDRGVHRVARVRERDREAVAGGGEHVTGAMRDRGAEDLGVAVQRRPHLRRVRFPQPCRTFDVGEQERHRPCRPPVHTPSLAPDA